jgi:type II secretory pathway pseudopilin PulG
MTRANDNPATGRRHPRRRSRGFTLIEAAFVTLVVGLACASLMQLLASGTIANAESAELTTGMNLANNLHEAMLPMTFAEVVATKGTDFSPPVDSRLKDVTDLGTNWKQHVDVVYVNPQQISATSGAAAQDTARVIVTVYHGPTRVFSTNWIISNAQ